MMNPMQVMQVINSMKQQANNNPVIGNAINLAEKHDVKGLEELARNLAKTRNVNVDEMINQIKSQLGMK